MKELSQLADHSRVWIYQSERNLTEEEVHEIHSAAQVFLEDWTSHGSTMNAAFDILHQRFIVFAVDEQTVPASGCGIDKSVRFLQELSTRMKIDFFQRTVIVYQNESGWEEAPLNKFWAMRKALIVNDQTLVCDTTMRTLGGLREKLIVAFKDSWHSEMWGR